MEDYVQLPLTATALRKWLRFSDKGGIGKAVGLMDRLAESGTDELMFMEGDPITVLMQLDNGRYLGSCEGVVGIFHEEDVRFVSKLKKPVFTKKQKPETDFLSSNVNSVPAHHDQSTKSPNSHVAHSPITPSAMSPAQTPKSTSLGHRSFSAPASATQLLYLQNDEQALLVQQNSINLDNDHKTGANGQNSQSKYTQDDRSLNTRTALLHNKPSLAQSSVLDMRSPSALSATEDNEDILSSYVYDAEEQPPASQVLPQRPLRDPKRSLEGGLTLPNNTYISSLPDAKREMHREASRLLAPLKISRSTSQTSDMEYLQETSSSASQNPISPRVHILPVLPAGVSLKQLRERSSPRFPLSPRSASMNVSMSRSTSGSQSLHFSPSKTPHIASAAMAQTTDFVQPYDGLWTDRPQTPIASPVPSSFVSAESPRSPLSPTSPNYPDYGSMAASTSASTFDFAKSPASHPLHQQLSLGEARQQGQQTSGLSSDARSVNSFEGSSKSLGHSRSMSSLTRAGSMFQRRPSLPNRSDSNLGSIATDGMVELGNAQFEFVQPSGWDSEGESPHSAAESLNSSTSARLVTRPSASAKERVRSIYISDSQFEGRETDRVLDKFGFIHSQHLNSMGGDSDVPNAQDTAALQAYRARELKWVSVMSTMPARNARSSNKVKKLVNHGIPNSVRGKAWTYLAETATRRREGLFHELCTKEECFEAAEIARDVAFCFHDHSHFADEDSIGRQDLCNILRALVHYLPNIQYRRGLSYMAGMLLLHTEAESAFWLLVAITCDYLPTYFSKGAKGGLLDANIVSYAIQRGEPDLYRHLEEQGVKLAAILESWLSCAFVRTLPWASQLRVMDLFFIGEKPSQLGIRVGLAVLDMLRENLLTRRRDAIRSLQNPPAELLNPASLIPSLLTIKLPSRTLKKATKWAKEQGSIP